MQFDQVQFLQSLRGAQAVVLLSYLMIGRAMTIEELQLCTGLSDDALRPALKCLASKGLLLKQTGQHGRGVWLPVGDTFFGRVFQNPVKPDSGALSCSSSNIKILSLPLQQEQEQEEQLPVKPDSAGVLAVLDAVGVREPKKSKLARLDHVTVELINGHVKECQDKGLQIGTAIYRIENNWPVRVVEDRRKTKLISKINYLRERSKET